VFGCFSSHFKMIVYLSQLIRN